MSWKKLHRSSFFSSKSFLKTSSYENNNNNKKKLSVVNERIIFIIIVVVVMFIELINQIKSSNNIEKKNDFRCNLRIQWIFNEYFLSVHFLLKHREKMNIFRKKSCWKSKRMTFFQSSSSSSSTITCQIVWLKIENFDFLFCMNFVHCWPN